VKTFQTMIALSAMCAVGNAASADVVLTSGEAFINGDALTGGIDERVDWDGTGSSFSALIDEEVTLSTGNFDRTVTQTISQDTSILGSIGDSFRGVSTISSAFGSIEIRDNLGGTNNFLDSYLDLRFTVEQPGFLYDLSGTLESTGGALSNTVTLRRFSEPDGGGIPLETIIGGNPFPSEDPFEFERSGELTPGFWVLAIRINGSVDGSVPPPSLTTGSYGWDVDFTIVPAPGATGVVAFAGLLATRRRRNRKTIPCYPNTQS
jgi:hypothetical protein